MTEIQFAKLVATPGDKKALRPEIASLPHHSNTEGTVELRYSNGNVIKEKCRQTTKTIDGRYIVYSLTSDSQKEPACCVVGYDENASAVRRWSLYENVLVEGTIVLDPKRKIFASTATFGTNLMQLTVNSFSEKEEFERSSLYKDGELLMTLEFKVWPIDSPKNFEQAGAEQPATRSVDKPEGSDKPQPEAEGRSR